MIKFIVAALWLCGVTVGAIFFSFSQEGQKTAAAEAPAPFFGGLDYVKADLISVPLIRNARVDGYVLAQLVYTAEPQELRKLSVPIQNLLADQAYSFIYADPAFDMAKFDLAGFKTGLRDSINKRVGSQLIHEVLIEQIDYLPKTDIRNKNPQRFPIPERDPEPPATDASGH
ncbi:MAG TPA: hypothetical protein VNS34_21300 [Rhizobiaceae bacterium]|nr:hypothetical protein [Rhizobiaceae bacterium]